MRTLGALVMAATCLPFGAVYRAGGVASAETRRQPSGAVQLALRTVGSAGTVFQLADARVLFTGPITMTAAADANNEFLIADLLPGDYTAQLVNGWQLLKVLGSRTEPVAARLVSQNPMPVSITAGQTTNVFFRFDLSGEIIPFGAGRARVGIEVTEPTTGGASGVVLLQNDGFMAGGNASFQAGFAAGECAASVFTSAQPGQVRVTKVELLVGGSAGNANIVVGVREVTQAGEPSTAVFESTVPVTASVAGTLNSVDLSANTVVVFQPFAISVCFTHDGLPSIASDADGSIASPLNWVRAPGWMRSSALGITGDWIVRAAVVPR